MHFTSGQGADMYAESNQNSDLLIASKNVSILEDDLALSSSTLDARAKSPCGETIVSNSVVYLNEDAMDCNYGESNSFQANSAPSSPDIFNIDDDDKEKEDPEEQPGNSKDGVSPSKANVEISFKDLVTKSDSDALNRVNKLLSGVPPPPKLTICQSTCEDFLANFRRNAHLFWTNFETARLSEQAKSKEDISRNLSQAFDACEESTDSLKLKISNDDTINSSSTFDSIMSNVSLSSNSVQNQAKTSSSSNDDKSILGFTTNEKEVADLTWPQAFDHKFHGIHYNRSTNVEELERLSLKLCERFVGAETQSSCNVFFSKQAPGSARKRYLMMRNFGQSPGKRLSHLAKRRTTFTSANIKDLGQERSKQRTLAIGKPLRQKGKSPRVKTGKTPRRSSAKKRSARKREGFSIDKPSPHRSKVETSKRALFQSPPHQERAGPSRILATNTKTQGIKRMLFPKKTDDSEKEENRKRKNEDKLENPRAKWPKSLSYDCSYEMKSNTSKSWESNRSTSALPRSNTDGLKNGKTEISENDRKKLYWSVTEALKEIGVTMTHPRFKERASSLVLAVKKKMPELENKNISRKPGSTTERMRQFAKEALMICEAKAINS